MKNKFRLTKRILSALLIMVLVFSFSTVAFAAGNADGNGGQGSGSSEEEHPGNSDENRKNDFALAIKAELEELKQLREQVRESHQANKQLREQIREIRQELSEQDIDCDEEKLERIRNAVQALAQEALKNRNCIENFRGDMAAWRENRKQLNVSKALANLNALQSRYRAMLTSQDKIADCLSVVLAHLESV